VWLQAEFDLQFAQTFLSKALVPPIEIFDVYEGLQLELGGEFLEVGPVHSSGNLVVDFPERKILFGGCAIIGWDQIGNIADVDLSAWPTSASHLERFDFDVLIPGHGERLDPTLLSLTLALLGDV
jgi:glyoxylase-like metal-dependent hydrolase (beta-lactamase superfamily II)